MAQLNESHSKIKQPPRTDDVATLRNYVANLADILAKLAKDLDYIINGNLDVKNIRANSITAKALDVDKLSAITANLGEITAGIIRGIEIYGSLIATNETGYPRTEMSTTDNYFKVWLNATNYLEVIASGDEGLPQIVFVSGTKRVKMGHGTVTSTLPGIYSNDPLGIFALGGLNLIGANFLSDWSFLHSDDDGKTLKQELDAIKSSISSLQSQVNGKADKGTSTSSAGSHNHGILPGTELLTPTGSVIWQGAPTHSHTQN